MSDDKTKIFSAMRARTQENINRQKAAEYTPTTATVRDAYMSLRRGSGTFSLNEFDRWKAENDRHVAAKALTDAVRDHGLNGPVGDTLLARAAAIVSQPGTPEAETSTTGES